MSQHRAERVSPLFELATLGLNTCDDCLRLCAGGVLTFPLMSPALATRMKFTQPQLTSIVLAYVPLSNRPSQCSKLALL